MERSSWPELEDVEKEILVRLPLEDLGRCKVVCKEWRNLISSPDFVSQHLKRSQLDPSRRLIIFHGSDPHTHGETTTTRPPGPFKSVVCFSSKSSFVVGSVNGLICVAGNFCDGVTSPDDIWILNPLTRLSILLPLPASPAVLERDSVSFALCWDSDCYKVFKIVCEKQHPRKPLTPSEVISLAQPIVSNRVEVWDSRYPHTWTEIVVDFPRRFYHPPGCFTSCDIVVGGRFSYWVVAVASGLDLLLLSIDMKAHVVKLISLPKLSIPSRVFVEQLTGLRNSFLFGAIWEERFALVEKQDRRMLFNVWAMNDSGTSWIKKTTFFVDFGFRRFIGCVDGKLLLVRDDSLNVLFDMRTQKCEVLGRKTRIPVTQEEDCVTVGLDISSSYINSLLSIQQQKNLLESKDMRNKKDVVVGFFEFPNTFVVSAHEFVGTLVSIEGFKPIVSFANCPHFIVFWPNPVVFASKVSSSSSSVALGEKVPPVFEPASVVVPPTRSANVPSKGSVPSDEKVKVRPVVAPAANEAPKPTYASLVAKWARVN